MTLACPTIPEERSASADMPLSVPSGPALAVRRAYSQRILAALPVNGARESDPSPPIVPGCFGRPSSSPALAAERASGGGGGCGAAGGKARKSAAAAVGSGGRLGAGELLPKARYQT